MPWIRRQTVNSVRKYLINIFSNLIHFRVAAEMFKLTMDTFNKKAKKGPLPSFFATIELKSNIEAFKMVN